MLVALDIFRALADPSRLRMLALLRRMELSVGELAQVLEQSQPRVSRHVKILCDAGLTVRRREGSWVFVALGQPSRTDPLWAAVDGWIAGKPDAQGAIDIDRLEAVRADRAAAAAQWFQVNAGQWDAIRSLHVAEEQVESAMATALGVAGGDPAPLGRLVDIGTGTGRMLELFAPHAGHATGIDRSSEMLRLARAKLTERGLDRAELHQADFCALPLAGGTADTAILHHVLHFAQAPDAVIGEAARVLNQGGRLLIVDFAPHAREELRTRDAHARLGFSDAQMLEWFAHTGLAPMRTETLSGGELTVKLWLGRKIGTAQPEARAA